MKFRDTSPPPTEIAIPSPATGRLVSKRRSDAWLSHPEKSQVQRVVFDPGLKPGNHFDLGVRNTFGGWPVSKKGSVRPFLELLEFVLRHKDERDWFLSWLSHPFRQPKIRSLQAAVLFSATNGSGEGQLVDAISKAHAPYFASAPFHSISNRFTGAIVEGKTLVLFDEGENLPGDVRPLTGMLKQLITDSTPLLERKYQDARMTDNRAQFILTTNWATAIHVAALDRRFFVPEVREQVLPVSLRNAINRWKSDPDCGAYLRHYFEKHRPVKSFDARGSALTTRQKDVFVEVSNSHVEYYASCVVNDRRWNGWVIPELTTPRSLLEIYLESHNGGPKPRLGTITNAMLGAGALRVGPGRNKRVVSAHGVAFTPILLDRSKRDFWEKQKATAFLDYFHRNIPTKQEMNYIELFAQHNNVSIRDWANKSPGIGALLISAGGPRPTGPRGRPTRERRREQYEQRRIWYDLCQRADRIGQERNLLWHTRFCRGHSPWGFYCVVPIDQKPPWDGVEHPWFDLLHQSTHPAANPEAYLCVLAKEIAIFPPVVLPSGIA